MIVGFGVLLSILAIGIGVLLYLYNTNNQKVVLETAYEEYDSLRNEKLLAETWLDRSFKSYERGQYEQAADQRKKTEDVGVSEILIRLADAYTEGNRAPKSLDDAERIYRKIGGSKYSFWILKTSQKLMRSTDKENQIRGADLLRTAAESGDQESIKMLARYYEHGNFFKQSFEEAEALYKQLSAAEYAKFLGRYGRKLANYVSNDENRKQGFAYLQQAVDLGYERAKFDVARCLIDGIGVKQDRDAGLAILTELSLSQDEKTRFDVGKLYLTRAFKYENEQGISIMKSLIDQDYEAAKNVLANYYFDASWRESDYGKAAKYFLMAESLTPEEKVRLGDLYRVGHGVDQDLDKALTLYKEATREFSHPQANISIGHMYRLGLGVKPDFLNALKYYKDAGQFENGDATYNIGRLYAIGIDGKPDLKEAIYYYEKAMERDQPEAYAALARFYEKGIGVKKSEPKAFELMRESGLLGSTVGRLGMAEYYERGVGCEPSEKYSAQWRSKLDLDPLAFE